MCVCVCVCVCVYVCVAGDIKLVVAEIEIYEMIAVVTFRLEFVTLR